MRSGTFDDRTKHLDMSHAPFSMSFMSCGGPYSSLVLDDYDVLLGLHAHDH